MHVSSPPRPSLHTRRQVHGRSTRVNDLRELRPGDVIEARQWDTTYYRGEVEDTAPELGVLWLLEESTFRSRKMICTQDYTLWVVSPSLPRR